MDREKEYWEISGNGKDSTGPDEEALEAERIAYEADRAEEAEWAEALATVEKADVEHARMEAHRSLQAPRIPNEYQDRQSRFAAAVLSGAIGCVPSRPRTVLGGIGRGAAVDQRIDPNGLPHGSALGGIGRGTPVNRDVDTAGSDVGLDRGRQTAPTAPALETAAARRKRRRKSRRRGLDAASSQVSFEADVASQVVQTSLGGWASKRAGRGPVGIDDAGQSAETSTARAGYDVDDDTASNQWLKSEKAADAANRMKDIAAGAPYGPPGFRKWLTDPSESQEEQEIKDTATFFPYSWHNIPASWPDEFRARMDFTARRQKQVSEEARPVTRGEERSRCELSSSSADTSVADITETEPSAVPETTETEPSEDSSLKIFKRHVFPGYPVQPGMPCGEGAKLKVSVPILPEDRTAGGSSGLAQQSEPGSSRTDTTAHRDTEDQEIGVSMHQLSHSNVDIDWNVVQMLTKYAGEGGSRNPRRGLALWKPIMQNMPLSDGLKVALLLSKSNESDHRLVSEMMIEALLDKDWLTPEQLQDVNRQAFYQIVKSLAPDRLAATRTVLFNAYQKRIRQMVRSLHDDTVNWPDAETGDNGFLAQLFPKYDLLQVHNRITPIPNLFMHDALHFLEASLAPTFELKDRSYHEYKHERLANHLGLFKKNLYLRDKVHPLITMANAYDKIRAQCIMMLRCSVQQDPYYFYYDLVRTFVVELIDYICDRRGTSPYAPESKRWAARQAFGEIQRCPMNHHEEYELMYDHYDTLCLVDPEEWSGTIPNVQWLPPEKLVMFYRRQEKIPEDTW